MRDEHVVAFLSRYMKQTRKTGLVALYNHNYENNIDLIFNLYRPNFSTIRQLMPFYRGDREGVISVFGNSFVFQTYIAQARRELQQMPCDDILIIGDDLLLNPELDEFNIHEKLNITPGAFYIDKVENICSGEFSRPLDEADKFSCTPPGLDQSANRWVPSYDEAFTILRSKGLIDSCRLRKYKPFYPLFRSPLLGGGNAYKNYRIFKARVYHFLKMLRYRIKPTTFAYPCVFGYSDLILIPKEKLDLFCRYLETFATWGMFVEMAIPTAMMLMPDTQVCHADNHRYRTGNVWYPFDPKHYERTNSTIDKLFHACNGDISRLPEEYPREYLYLHPVKLSRFKAKSTNSAR